MIAVTHRIDKAVSTVRQCDISLVIIIYVPFRRVLAHNLWSAVIGIAIVICPTGHKTFGAIAQDSESHTAPGFIVTRFVLMDTLMLVPEAIVYTLDA